MKIVIHDHLKQPRTLEATRVVIYDDNDNPLGYALEYGPGMIITDTLGAGREEAFGQALKQMGINRTVHVEKLDLRSLRDVRFEG